MPGSVGRSVGKTDLPSGQWGVLYEHTPVSIPVFMNTTKKKVRKLCPNHHFSRVHEQNADFAFRTVFFSVGLGGKGESADRAQSLPRPAIEPVKFPGYIEPGDEQSTITIMFGGNMYENSCNDSTALWSPDPESFSGLRKRKSHCAPEYAPRARSPIG